MKGVTPAHANEAIRRRARWKAVEFMFWAAAAASYFLFPARLVLLTQILITGLFAMALDVLLGYGGIASLGHAAFFGVGAYTAGLLASHHWGEPISGLIAAGAMAGALGLLVSTVIVRVHGVAVFVVTMCVGLLIYEVANRIPWITGGDTGLQGIVMWPLLGRFDFDLFGKTGFWYTYAVSLTMYLLVRRYISSPEGLALEGMRENALRIAAIGISASRRKLIAFTISAVIAGIAGALLAQITQVVALETLSFDRSVSTLIILIVGGLGTLLGGFVGAAAFVWAHDILSSLNPIYWMFWLGLILIGTVLVARGGIVGGLTRLSAHIWKV
jgi:branched-chain amino acid transport system permease protein